MGPRHIGLLSDDALEILATMCNLWELGGCYPRFMEAVIVKLLVKKDGGSRPIMLFRSVFRIHCKARKGFATKWETTKAAGAMFNRQEDR